MCSADDDTETGPSVFSWEDALIYCDDLEWGGFDDWRLPDEYALHSIANYNVFDPSFYETAFPATANGEYWSSSSSADDADRAWAVNLIEGEMNDNVADERYVRCVRSDSWMNQTRTISISDNERKISDSVNNLVWQGCSAGKSGTECSGSATGMSWRDALSYCEALEWGGHDDWRLPNVIELRNLVDSRLHEPSINESFFPGTENYYYWSSTSKDHLGAWGVDFSSGYVSNTGKGYFGGLDVRCVRTGP